MKRNTKRHDLEKPYTPDQLAKLLTKAHGLEYAWYLAKGYAKDTDPKLAENLPRGLIFFDKLDGDKWSRKDGEFKKLNNFWNQVFNILNKQYKQTKKARIN